MNSARLANQNLSITLLVPHAVLDESALACPALDTGYSDTERPRGDRNA